MTSTRADPAVSRASIEIVRYGDLTPTPELYDRAGLTEPQVRSLQAHPYARPEDAAVIALRRERRLFGRFGLIPGRVMVAGHEHALSWSSDWFARDPGNPAAGAPLLLGAIREAGSIGCCGISPPARAVLSAARFEVVRLRRWIILLRGPALWRRHLPDALARALAVPTDLVLGSWKVASGWKRRAWTQGYVVEEVDRFDDGVDRIEERGRGGSWFPRDHRELNWAFDRPWFPPDRRDRYGALVLRGRDGDLVAYAMLRSHEYGPLLAGSLLRWGAVSPRGGARAVLAAALDWFAQQGVDLVDLASSRPAMLRAARDAGMAPHGHIDLALRLSGDAAAWQRSKHITLSDFEADLGEGDLLFA